MPASQTIASMDMERDEASSLRFAADEEAQSPIMKLMYRSADEKSIL
jgi:hypothetical protein